MDSLDEFMGILDEVLFLISFLKTMTPPSFTPTSAGFRRTVARMMRERADTIEGV